MRRDRAAEVVTRDRNLVDAELVEKAVDSLLEELEVVVRALWLVGSAEPGQVERDHAVGAGDRWHHVAPEEG